MRNRADFPVVFWLKMRGKGKFSETLVLLKLHTPLELGNNLENE